MSLVFVSLCPLVDAVVGEVVWLKSPSLSCESKLSSVLRGCSACFHDDVKALMLSCWWRPFVLTSASVETVSHCR